MMHEPGTRRGALRVICLLCGRKIPGKPIATGAKPGRDHNVYGVVGAYIEPDSATKSEAMQRSRAWCINLLWCVLGAGVGTEMCHQVLRHFGWGNWTGIHKSPWQPDWNTLPASLAGSMATSFFIRWREYKRRHLMGLPKDIR